MAASQPVTVEGENPAQRPGAGGGGPVGLPPQLPHEGLSAMDVPQCARCAAHGPPCGGSAAGVLASGHHVLLMAAGVAGPGWRVRGMRIAAMAPAARARAPQTANAPWKPAVSAAAGRWPVCSRAAVREAAMVVVTARPIAPPICWLVLIIPDAMPASADSTPVVEAMKSPTKATPSAAATSTKPGSRWAA